MVRSQDYAFIDVDTALLLRTSSRIYHAGIVWWSGDAWTAVGSHGWPAKIVVRPIDGVDV